MKKQENNYYTKSSLMKISSNLLVYGDFAVAATTSFVVIAVSKNIRVLQRKTLLRDFKSGQI